MPDQPRRERIVELADQCVKCGLCLPHCPTYGLDRTEAESPRGRIALASAVATGDLAVDASVRRHLDYCLGCLSCQEVCPSHVRYGDLLVQIRAMLGPSPRRPNLLLAILKQPRWLRALQLVANFSGAPRWAPRLARGLPRHSSWRAVLELLPASEPPMSMPPLQMTEPARGRVALFPGCIGSVHDTRALHAARRLLGASGYAVDMLPAMCCGAMDAHGGHPDAAVLAAGRLRSELDTVPTDVLLSVTPGCLGTLREALPGHRVDDVLAFLAREGSGLRFRYLPQRVALHLPCTQVNVAHAGNAVRDLLLRVPGIELLPLPLQPRCCGAAGTYMLEYPERAAQLRDAKLAQAESLSPQRLLSGNIGCRLYLAGGLRQRGSTVPVEHPLVLLAQQLEESPSA